MNYSHAHAESLGTTEFSPAHEKPFVMIDGFNVGLVKGTGVATYTRNLSNSLRNMGCDVGILYGGAFSAKHSQLLKEVLFFDSPSPELTRLKQAVQALKAVSMPGRHSAFEVPITGAVVPDPVVSRLPDYDSIWNAPDIFVRALQRFRLLGVTSTVSPQRTPDLCHWTYPLPLRVNGVPNIYTLHDLVPLRLPHTTLDRKERYLKLVSWICRTADHIVTVSENSKRDIIELLGVEPSRVTNTYQAVSIPDVHLKKPEDVVRREVEGTFGLDFKGYFLFFGSIEPKKNIGRLIESYLASGTQTPLVIVGAQAWKSEQELSLLPVSDLRSKLRPDQRMPGSKILKIEYVPYGMLINLIRGAKGTLFPSLYEGFGLPVLESMLLGTPVLTSDTSSVPEIAGDAALLINPYDVRDIADGIRAFDSDPQLRAELASRGRRRAAMFDETAYRSRLTSVYREVIRSRARTEAA